MSQIVWLASYPKSGNTWLRALLANYQRDDGQPADINALGIAPLASKRPLFDEGAGVESSDLTPDEVDGYRPAVYRQLASESAETLMLKIHDAYTLTPRAEPLIPADASRGAIYLLRNPLDVAVSFSYHSRHTIDQSIGYMADETYSLANASRHLPSQLRQKLLSWSAHVLSWVDQKDLPVHLIRYEDLLVAPARVFQGALQFIGWPSDASRIERAVRRSTFKNLQAQERARGFQERPPRMESFFRNGQAGAWRAELNDEQVARILRDHGQVMRRFGYLSQSGQLLNYPQ